MLLVECAWMLGAIFNPAAGRSIWYVYISVC